MTRVVLPPFCHPSSWHGPISAITDDHGNGECADRTARIGTGGYQTYKRHRSSTPLWGYVVVLGGFDSHALPPADTDRGYWGSRQSEPMGHNQPGVSTSPPSGGDGASP